MISREAVTCCSHGREPVVGCRRHGIAPKVATAVRSIARIPAGNRRLSHVGSFFFPLGLRIGFGSIYQIPPLPLRRPSRVAKRRSKVAKDA